ncbi:MAG: hypothetical protein HQ581_16490 [Planctomycetes bacterium]|nr:hypothetical protein [Planctomycetota bacterium]
MSDAGKPSLLMRIVLSKWLAGLLLVAGAGAVTGSTAGYYQEEELLRIARLPHNRNQDSIDIHRNEITVNKIIFSAGLGALALACTSLVLGGRVRGSWRQDTRADGAAHDAVSSLPGKCPGCLGLLLLFSGLVVAAIGTGGAIQSAYQMRKNSHQAVTDDWAETSSKPEMTDLFFTGQKDISFTYSGLLRDKHGKISSRDEAEELWDSLGEKYGRIGGRQLALQMTAEEARKNEAWIFGSGFSSRQRAAGGIDESGRKIEIRLERMQLADILEGAFRQDQYRPRYARFLNIAMAGGAILLTALVVLFLRKRAN